MVIQREVLEAIKFHENFHGTVEDCYFDEHLRHAGNVDLWLRISVQTDWQFESIPEPLIMYRLHSAGNSANLSRTLKSWERFIEKARSYAPELIDQCGRPAMAYVLRFLARKAVTMKEGAMALYSQMETMSLRSIGASQRRRIRRDQSKQGCVAKTGRF